MGVFCLVVLLVLVGVPESGLRLLLLGECVLHGLIVHSELPAQHADRLLLVAQHGQQQVFRVGPLGLHGPCLEEHQLDDAAAGIAEQRVALPLLRVRNLFESRLEGLEVNAHSMKDSRRRAVVFAQHGQQQVLRLHVGALQPFGFLLAVVNEFRYFG